jgi:DNA-binding response OmpR family regulator
MLDSVSEPTRGRVLLLEPNAALRSAILTILAEEHFEAESVDSFDAVVAGAASTEPSVALVAWQSMGGLLAEENRHQLMELNRRLQLLIMVPRRWARLLDATDLPSAVAGLISKPFEADELIARLEHALARVSEPTTVTN